VHAKISWTIECGCWQWFHICPTRTSNWNNSLQHIWGTVLQARRSRVRFPMVSLEFFIEIILPAYNRNEYQEYFWGRGKGSWCVGLTTLPPTCADCLEIWEPQPPGTPRACNGIALLSTFCSFGLLPCHIKSSTHASCYTQNIAIYSCTAVCKQRGAFDVTAPSKFLIYIYKL
jgi:hypothetical protein